ncbi:MAG: 50S ribosomal protein L18e [Candidatus Aenigmatarchaeota archaeon]
MVKPTGPTNPYLRRLIIYLEKASKKNNAKIWKYVAELLSRPTRRRVEVNLYKINRYAKDGDIILVPGKVLSIGEINKKITISAWSFSKKALEKLKEKNIEVLSIKELVEKNPKGSNVKIII